MAQLLYSLGGFVVGGGVVYTYAKATNQKVEWRGVPFIKHFYIAFHGDRRQHA